MSAGRHHECALVTPPGPEAPPPAGGAGQACSSSTRTPPQSLGCRKITGFPCAPIWVSSLRLRIFFSFRSATAALMLSTWREGRGEEHAGDHRGTERQRQETRQERRRVRRPVSSAPREPLLNYDQNERRSWYCFPR